MRASARFLLLLAPLAGWSCGSALHDGTYAFTTTAILQDSCSAVPQAELLLPDGTLQSAGETLELAFSAEGPLVPGLTGATGVQAMIGRYLPDREVDRFIADSTFDVVREIGGISCIVFAHASIRARVLDQSTFAGTLRIDYSRRREAQPACPPGCVVEVDFEARRTGD